jgi:hypothetical protein
MSGALAMGIVIVGTLAVLALLIFSMVRSIQTARTGERPIWREFGLGLILMVLFFVSWVGHGVVEWQVFVDDQSSHGEPAEIGDFAAEFGKSTLENWQSEFLQLFSFVVLAALYVHRGSAESKDSEENIEASLRRIEEHLGTLPAEAPTGEDGWKLPDTPMHHEG